MRSFRLAVLFLTISSWGALAADNAVIVTPGSGVTMRSKDIGAGVQSMMPIPGDVAGNPLATAPGSGNASYALPMQGVVGGVAMPISGTITANAGTNLNTSALALESGGNLATIAGAITSSVMQVNLKQLNGAALGSPSNYGTSPGAVEVQGVNAYVTNSVAVTGTFYQATQPVSIASAQVASGAFASGSLAAGSMVDLLTMRAAIAGTGSEPADVLAEGCQYNSSLPTFTNTFVGGAQCDASGRQIVVGAGVAGTAAGGVVTVQGVASMTPVQVSQATAASLNATVVGTGTFAVQATLQASATTAIGKVDPNTIATWGLMSGTTPGTAPTNTLIMGGIYNSSPPGPTTGQTLPFQLDSAGNLNVNIKAGAGSGGTALADGATFTEASTSFTPVGGEYVSGGGASCTTGKGCTVQMTIDRMAYVNIGKVGGAATGTAGSAGTGVLTVQGIASMTPILANPGTIATWGLATLGGATAPTNAQSVAAEYLSSPPTYTNGQAGVLQMTAAGSLHTTVDNTNANGSAVSAFSSPVVIASDQAAVAVKAASAAFASGSIASGALASGSIASGAMVDLLTVIGTKAAGTAAADSLLGGVVYNSTLPAPTNGQQTAAQADNQGRAITAPGSILSHTLVKGTTAAMTGTTSTQLIALVSSQRIYPTHISCNNSSSTATLVSIQDGSAGTTLMTLIAPAGGGDTESDIDALTWTTAGNGLYAADVTTGASVICSASGHSSAN